MQNENWKRHIEIAEVTAKDNAVSKNNYFKAAPVLVQKSNDNKNNSNANNKE